jgi:hypothetical protein
VKNFENIKHFLVCFKIFTLKRKRLLGIRWKRKCSRRRPRCNHAYLSPFPSKFFSLLVWSESGINRTAP